MSDDIRIELSDEEVFDILKDIYKGIEKDSYILIPEDNYRINSIININFKPNVNFKISLWSDADWTFKYSTYHIFIFSSMISITLWKKGD